MEHNQQQEFHLQPSYNVKVVAAPEQHDDHVQTWKCHFQQLALACMERMFLGPDYKLH